jgi:hypothetical protein
VNNVVTDNRITWDWEYPPFLPTNLSEAILWNIEIDIT